MEGTLFCRWTDCFCVFNNLTLLGQHLFNEHSIEENNGCCWDQCSELNSPKNLTNSDAKVHLLSHAVFEFYCWNSYKLLVDRGFGFLGYPVRCIEHAQSSDACEPSTPKGAIAFNSSCDISIPKKESSSSCGPFGCYSCRIVFKTDVDYLQHILPAMSTLLPNDLRDTTSYKCHWLGCNQTFKSHWRLHNHVELEHWSTDLTPFCLWRYCSNDTTKLTSATRGLRHLLLHSFIEACICLSNKRLLLRHKDWNVQCGGISYQKPSIAARCTDHLLWHKDVLDRGFRCRWVSCTYHTNSAQLFADHVIEHAATDIGEKGPYLCSWDSSDTMENCELKENKLCNREVSQLSVLKEHLYRHTGLPKFICASCRVGFCEFDSFVEHFSWSLSETSTPLHMPTLNTESNDPAQTSTNSIRSQICRSAQYRCIHCSKRFLTRHRLHSHQSNSRCAVNRLAVGRLIESPASTARSGQDSNTPSNAGCSLRVTSTAISMPIQPTTTEEKRSMVFCCQIEGCHFQTHVYSTYRNHFRRYHSTVHPDGLWYACHICQDFRARKARTLTLHLRGVHHFEPQNGRQRFSYTLDRKDGMYRMTGLPEPKPVNALRTILPR